MRKFGVRWLLVAFTAVGLIFLAQATLGASPAQPEVEVRATEQPSSAHGAQVIRSKRDYENAVRQYASEIMQTSGCVGDVPRPSSPSEDRLRDMTSEQIVASVRFDASRLAESAGCQSLRKW